MMVTVQLWIGVVEHEQRIPLMTLPEGATADDRRSLDRWRMLVRELNGYTAVTAPEQGNHGSEGEAGAA